MIRLPRLLAWAFSAAASAAFGLMSMATTFAAPTRATASARMPDPVPTSATRLPVRSREEEVREEFAREKISWVEHCRSDCQTETGHARHRCPNVRLGLSLSSHGRRSCDRPHSAIENSPVPSQNFIRLKKLNDSRRLETILHPRWHTPFLGGAGLPQVAGRRSG
jgi:hypothetical protein